MCYKYCYILQNQNSLTGKYHDPKEDNHADYLKGNTVQSCPTDFKASK